MRRRAFLAPLVLALAVAGAMLAGGCPLGSKPAAKKASSGDISSDEVYRMEARLDDLMRQARALPQNKPDQIIAATAILNDLRMVKIELTRKNPLENTLPVAAYGRAKAMLDRAERNMAAIPR